jgi:hypothetical protein
VRPLLNIQAIAFLTLLGGMIGCAGIDRANRNMDIASEHVSTDKPIYEGHLQAVKRVGALTALQFTDGQSFEVVECQTPLVPGDVVRIHKLEKGFVAHLWQAAPIQVPPGTIPPVPAPSRSK